MPCILLQFAYLGLIMEGDHEAAALPKMSVLTTYLISRHSYRLRLYLFLMVRRVGFELTMFALRDWFYRPVRHRHRRCRRIFGAHKKIRTSYLQIRSLLLYPNELHGLIMVDLTRLELVTFRLSGERSYQLSYRSMVEITRIELVSRRFHFGFIRLSNPSIPMGRSFRIELKFSEPQSNVIAIIP